VVGVLHGYQRGGASQGKDSGVRQGSVPDLNETIHVIRCTWAQELHPQHDHGCMSGRSGWANNLSQDWRIRIRILEGRANLGACIIGEESGSTAPLGYRDENGHSRLVPFKNNKLGIKNDSMRSWRPFKSSSRINASFSRSTLFPSMLWLAITVVLQWIQQGPPGTKAQP
jgi:hypothetical protein